MAEEMLDFEDEELVFKYLTFRVSKKVYAIDVSVVAEISQRCELLPIPEFPDYIMGLAQIKNENVPVINPHARFQDKDPNPDDEQKCIIVVENEAEDNFIGIMVDKIGELVEINPDYIAPPPKVSAKAYTRYITGSFNLNGSVVFILNLPLMINDDDAATVNATTKK